jgi:hypothetical protein
LKHPPLVDISKQQGWVSCPCPYLTGGQAKRQAGAAEGEHSMEEAGLKNAPGFQAHDALETALTGIDEAIRLMPADDPFRAPLMEFRLGLLLRLGRAPLRAVPPR